MSGMERISGIHSIPDIALVSDIPSL